MGLGPLAQPLFYQYKCTLKPADGLQGNGSAQSKAMHGGTWSLISKADRFSTECPAGRAAARGHLGHCPSPCNRRMPGHRSRGRTALPATYHHTGPGAEGGGGWPMHATAQPWHAEGRPLPTGALRCLLSPRERRGAPPAARPGGCHGSSAGRLWRLAACSMSMRSFRTSSALASACTQTRNIKDVGQPTPLSHHRW